jgi:four helix bundle protein
MTFHHEKLDVYRVAIEFTSWVGELLDRRLVKCRLSAVKQLDRAATSIPLNIAEGNGKRSPKDRSRYLDIARGSALECAACLDVLVARHALNSDDVATGKNLLRRVVEMVSKMASRFHAVDNEDDYDREPRATIARE